MLEECICMVHPPQCCLTPDILAPACQGASHPSVAQGPQPAPHPGVAQAGPPLLALHVSLLLSALSRLQSVPAIY